MARGLPPTLEEELKLWEQGFSLVAGIDEVGRGALAGPVGAAAVVLPAGIDLPWLGRVRDSKLLTPKEREQMAVFIEKHAVAAAVALVPADAIDAQGILPATRLAMARALEGLPERPEFLLIDGIHLPRVNLPQKAIIHGDRLCSSIACASILAKVTRDRLMSQLDIRYPGYGMAQHKGYGTVEHVAQIQARGPCPEHRRSFEPVKSRYALL